MVEGLDMTLEELIQKNKRSKRQQQEDGNSGSHGSCNVSGRYRRRLSPVHVHENRAPATTRLSMGRFECIPAPYCMLPPPPPLPPLPPPPPPPPPPPHSLEHQIQGMSIRTKLFVSNLNYEVTENDMKVLFSDIGPLKHCMIHYDKSGKSKGTGEVVFVYGSDAARAFRRYNDLRLDGRLLKIEFGEDISSTPNPPTLQRSPVGTSRPKGRYPPSAPCDVVETFRGACTRHTPPVTEDPIGNGAGGYGKYAPLPMGGLVGNLNAAYGSGASLLTDDIKQYQTRHFGRPGPLPADWNQRKYAEREKGSSLVHTHAHESKQKIFPSEKTLVEALDADLDKYLQEAKKKN